MLKFEGLKEFDIEKIDDKPHIARNFQIVFTDDFVDEKDSEEVEKILLNHNFTIKDEKVNINVIYNIDLDITTITMNIYCPLMHRNQINEEKLLNFMDRHRINFEEYYNQVKPY